MQRERLDAGRRNRRIVFLEDHDPAGTQTLRQRSDRRHRIRLIHQDAPADDGVKTADRVWQFQEVSLKKGRRMSWGALACNGNGNGSGIVINADDLPVSSHEITQQKRHITRTATYVQDSHPFSNARIDQQACGEVESVERHYQIP
jgi:hypothetical protein